MFLDSGSNITAVRNDALVTAAKDLEFVAFSFCSTPRGYVYKTTATEEAVKMLARKEVWENNGDQHEALEDAREVAESVRAACIALHQDKGKGREIL